MAIFLIRHGETDFNTAKIVQTPATPLNRRGIAQADRLASRLAQAGIAAILSSDLTRAVMTAERVQAATGAPLRFTPLLQERNYGDIRGMAYVDVGVDIFAPDYAPPGGECWENFHARVDAAWEEVGEAISECAGNLAVVTHGLVCYSLALRRLRLPEGRTASRDWGNASVTIIEPHPPWAVRLLNCTAHLDRESGDGQGSVSGL